ncbi:hypothetical protein VIGAN_03161300, partial [Vigna angularis var. angularis]
SSSIQESSRVQQEGPPGVEGRIIKLASIRNIPRPTFLKEVQHTILSPAQQWIARSWLHSSRIQQGFWLEEKGLRKKGYMN